MVNPFTKQEKVINIKVQERLRKGLIADGVITEEQLRSAEETAEREKETLSKVLVNSGYVTEEALVNFIGDKMNIPYVNIRNYSIDKKVLELIPEHIARRHTVIPLFKIEDVLTIAMSDPLDIVSFDAVLSTAQCKVEAVIASDKNIYEAIDTYYGVKDTSQGPADDRSGEVKGGAVQERPHKEIKEQPVVKIVDSLIVRAIEEGASDIHLEPKKDRLLIRFRIDGFLYDKEKLPLNLVAQITSRIKIMAGLDISRKRVPQDGRISLTIQGRSIDLRTSTFPSLYGENVVLRVLDRTSNLLTPSVLGFSDKDLSVFNKLIKSTKGIILATGPTGSGKTTTIYSAINTINTTDKNIMTIEDPIEYEIEGIVQSQVNPKAGVTFANALGSILRQDPDLIYVGEIRDLDTADIAMRAALTGHLVLTTLHTNSAVGAIVRLNDIGVDKVLIESALICSFSQRLVRKVCSKCVRAYIPEEGVLKHLRLPLDTQFYKGEGCVMPVTA